MPNCPFSNKDTTQYDFINIKSQVCVLANKLLIVVQINIKAKAFTELSNLFHSLVSKAINFSLPATLPKDFMSEENINLYCRTEILLYYRLPFCHSRLVFFL